MKRNPITMIAAWLTLSLAPGHAVSAADAASAQTGTLTGQVSNAATGNMLEGATVKLPELGLTTLTDNTGRFVFNAVPAGTREVVASYVGLDPMRMQVVVAPGQQTRRDFDLTSNIYRMQEFRVTGEMEGNAAAITAQRNADNVMNTLATDAFGNLPNLAASELAIRLPGIAGLTDVSGTNSSFVVRGMSPGFNTITVDGGLLLGGSDGLSRRMAEINQFTGAMFDQIELIKGHTPDKGAASLGGTLNFKSRSTLSMKEKRRVTYNLSASLRPAFTQQIPAVAGHRLHPLLNVSYQEVFGIFGEERNLGVAINLYYTETFRSSFRTNRDFQNTLSTPAYVWEYRVGDAYVNRKLWSTNVKLDYRLSAATKLTFNAIYNDNNGANSRFYEMRAFTGQSVGTTGNAGILPGYTDRITQVRATPGSTIDIQSYVLNTWERLRNVKLGVEHEIGPLQLDLNAIYNRNHVNSANGGEAGMLTNRIANVGWILDRTGSDLYPRFIQTEGPDITNPANYLPAPGVGFQNVNDGRNERVMELIGNARYKLPARFPAFLKSGFTVRDHEVTNESSSRRWNYIGATALPADPTIVTFASQMTGLNVPMWNSSALFRNREPITPALWDEDLYFREQRKFTGTRGVTETVTAGYVMGQAKMGGTGLLTGVRTEKTEVESWGWVRARVGSTTAQRTVDPIGSAQRDYANTRRELNGSYTKSFPSVHLTQEITRNLKARLSWSTSFGRPTLSNYLPNETPNETNQTITINNPGLNPQTSSNWDATLDYYFEPVGNLSVGWFKKTIKDYIVAGVNAGVVPTGTDNGYNGEYGGFTQLTSSNAGTAFVQGWEFSYQQQFTFLPGLLKGLSALANYTLLDTHGDFGGTTSLSTGQVAGFIPRTGNLSLSWRYRRFNARVLYNYTGSYIASYSPASLARNLYRFERKVINVGVQYELRQGVSLACDIDNLFNEPTKLYRGIPDQMQATNINGTTITVGLTGRF